MKITDKIISDVVSDLIGEDAVNVALYVKSGTKVSEFDVAKQMKIDLHLARAILYKLYENNILVFERKKDRQKGWYVTYWDFNPTDIEHMYLKVLKQKIDKLKERLEKEKNFEFYMCKNACTRMDFEKAFNSNFKCPECGELMNPMDNKRTIEFLEQKITELKNEYQTIISQPKEKKPDLDEDLEKGKKKQKKEEKTEKKKEEKTEKKKEEKTEKSKKAKERKKEIKKIKKINSKKIKNKEKK